MTKVIIVYIVLSETEGMLHSLCLSGSECVLWEVQWWRLRKWGFRR